MTSASSYEFFGHNRTAFLLPFALCCLVRFAPAQTPACQPVAADQVLGKDLAAALPAFAALPPDTLLANMPPPGSRRIFHWPELAAIAKRYAIELEAPGEVCFEWPLQPLDRNRVLNAMRTALGISEAQIEIADLSLVPAPPGQLDFPRERLGTPAGSNPREPVLWRGDVVYGDSHRFPVWARVRISAPCNRVVAAENLKTGQPLKAGQIRVSSAQCFPAAARSGLKLEQVVGMSLRRPVASGAEIVAGLLAAPKDVNRGDPVSIEVFSGAAHLEFVGKAETAGSAGELIAVRNPTSNRIFRARVDGKGKAVVEVPW
jgi:flagella basal body P-ring formation protein FlgA